MWLASRSVLVFILSLFLLSTSLAGARGNHGYGSELIQSVSIAELPPEAITTLKLIKQGGPYPYPRDGVVFGNFEKRLPKKQRGYYHEYTVKTPGARNRGARRIVCGLASECYYTADHYGTFKLIRE
jgi:ribonuclease T1